MKGKGGGWSKGVPSRSGFGVGMVMFMGLKPGLGGMMLLWTIGVDVSGFLRPK